MKTYRSIKRNPTLDGLAEISPDIVYSHAGGKDLTLRVIYPWKNDANADRRYPLILFIQGSGWTFPNINHITVPRIPRKLRDLVIDVRERPSGALNEQDQRIAPSRIRFVPPRIDHAQGQIFPSGVGVDEIRRNFRQTVQGGISLNRTKCHQTNLRFNVVQICTNSIFLI